MKYIITNKNGCAVPVLFPSFVSHKDMAKEIGGTPMSAGFCRISDVGGVICEGESISLELESKDNDADLINVLLLRL